MSKRLTTEEFIRRSDKVHNKMYIYTLSEYITQLDKLTITCPLHGEFKQTPANHMQGQGCPECGLKIQKSAQLSNKEDFVSKAILKHGDTYTYEKVKYTGNKVKVLLTCKTHGDFLQSPNMHLKGRGCPDCHLMKGVGYSRTDFINISKGRPCIFYSIRLFNENENFYKIGITSRSTKVRYSSFSKMPYKYEILQEVEGNAGDIWDLELKNKKLLKNYKYKPLIKFKGGATECFTKII